VDGDSERLQPTGMGCRHLTSWLVTLAGVALQSDPIQILGTSAALKRH
jgi:hypothetical protein